jgi:hypothetical protein
MNKGNNLVVCLKDLFSFLFSYMMLGFKMLFKPRVRWCIMLIVNALTRVRSYS